MKIVLRGLILLGLVSNFFIMVSNCGDCCSPRSINCPTSLCCYSNCCLSECDGYPFLAHRSQSVDVARKLVGWQQLINKYDMAENYGTLSIGVEYTRTFNNERLAQFLFGGDLINCCKLLIQGSDAVSAEYRDKRAWLADYFGLPAKYCSEVTFCPRIQNVIVDFNFYYGLEELADGLYFRLQAPIVWSRWDLGMCERRLETDSDGSFIPGYMNSSGLDRDDLPEDFVEAVSGEIQWGDMKDPMKFGRMPRCAMKRTRLSDIHAVLGWNFLQDEDYHCGLNLQIAAPTGNRPSAIYLFEPIVGNGKHWELGFGFSGSWIFGRSEEKEDHHFGLWMDANVTHMFKTCQTRSFDFCGKSNSRYMLLEQMGSNPADASQITGDVSDTPANYKYQSSLIPAVNYTTFNVDVKINIQADIAIKFGWIRGNCSFDVGYNLWARSGEKFYFAKDSCCCGCPSNMIYAVKGDAYVYGFNGVGGTPYALSATQKNADIHSGEQVALANPFSNAFIDNPEDAQFGAPPGQAALTDFFGSGSVGTSIQPEIVSFSKINGCKSPAALTHKVFAHFNYIWKDDEQDTIPFLGLGGFAEFSSCKKSCCSTSCGSSKRGGVSQWGIWLKGGVAFE